MRLAWLAVAVLLASMGTSEAKRIQCACPAEITVPERNAANVPANAKTWLLGTYGAVHYSSRIPAAELMGVHALERAPGTSSSERDDTPPAAPRDVQVTLSTAVRALLERPGTIAVRHGVWLLVGAGASTARLLASNQDFAQAKQAAVPRSVVK